MKFDEGTKYTIENNYTIKPKDRLIVTQISTTCIDDDGTGFVLKSQTREYRLSKDPEKIKYLFVFIGLAQECHSYISISVLLSFVISSYNINGFYPIHWMMDNMYPIYPLNPVKDLSDRPSVSVHPRILQMFLSLRIPCFLQ